MNICHFTSVHSWKDTRILYKEASSLSQYGWHVTLVVCMTDNLTVSSYNGVHIVKTCKPHTSRIFRFFIGSFSIARRVISIRSNVYHFHDPELLPVGLLLRFLGYNVVYDIHEDVPRQILSKIWIHPWLRRITSLLFEQFENFASRRMTALVTATPHIRQRFERVHPLVINVNNYPLPDELAGSAPWEAREQAVCYIGAITRLRGAREIVEAMDKTSVRLCIAGSFGDRGLEAELQELVGWRQVEYHGFVNRVQAQAILDRCKAGLVLFQPAPNHIDAQPNKMFEYMSAGIPVIASNFPLWREIIEGNGCGICVDPEDPAAIASAIEWIIAHDDEARAMGERGRQLVLNSHNWPAEAEKLIGLYRDLTGSAL